MGFLSIRRLLCMPDNMNNTTTFCWGFTHSDVDDSIYPTFAVLLKHRLDIFGLGEITFEGVDLCAVFLLFRSIFG